ncbi:unnamed protein product [Penicillium salamii]|nr:unnamed protein product [Penicillium salamii]CAG8420422.1 unnamed protein product [Penicillium salamii]
MTSKWQRLHLSDQSVPPLLFQYTWTKQGYEIYITDLAYIWSERLSQKQIIKRAEEDATTIDPGEDSEQLNVLLEKIGEALQKGKDSAALGSGAQTNSLEVKTTTKLPAPLKPLRWNLKLVRESPSYLTSKMLLPLINEEANWELRQRSLLQQIKQKDLVLSKLLDKIETTGVDLGTVFPSAAGSRSSRKATTRSEAARFVKGIEPFDEQTWLAKTALSDGTGLANNLLQELTGSGEPGDISKFSQPQAQWWHQLTGLSGTTARDTSQDSEHPPRIDRNYDEPVSSSHVDIEGESTASSDDDEFQSEPAKSKRSPLGQKPGKKSPSPVPLPAEPDDEATASDSDPEPEPRRNRIPTVSKSPEPPAPVPQEKPSRKTGGLGVIGGKKSKEGYSVAPTQPRSSPEHQGAQKSPQEDRFNDSPPPTFSTPPQRETNAKRPGKLGMIGGKAKAKVHVPVQNDPSPPVVETRALSPDQSSLTQSKDTREATPDVVRKEGSPLSASRTAETSTSGPPAELETDEQRADRRREELKRALEAKGKAPAKKKRRF